MIAEHQKFADKTITLDGGSFYGCTFDRCMLLYGGTLPVVLNGNTFNQCTWDFVGQALQVRAFLRQLIDGGGHDIVNGLLGPVYGPTTLPPISMTGTNALSPLGGATTLPSGMFGFNRRS